jgi:hypothetical protein
MVGVSKCKVVVRTTRGECLSGCTVCVSSEKLRGGTLCIAVRACWLHVHPSALVPVAKSKTTKNTGTPTFDLCLVPAKLGQFSHHLLLPFSSCRKHTRLLSKLSTQRWLERGSEGWGRERERREGRGKGECKKCNVAQQYRTARASVAAPTIETTTARIGVDERG